MMRKSIEEIALTTAKKKTKTKRTYSTMRSKKMLDRNEYEK